ncbi:MAG: DnaA N-terminal domain-containing protein [Anaerolineales bacterium]|nr:MAG: DnaA N-terminal domain-containing protein [Anaerolineales bacterium]
MTDLQQGWSSVLAQLQLDMPRASYETWVVGTVALGLENDVLLVSTRNAYARDWLESRLTSTVQRLLVGILNRSVSVKFVVGDESQAEAEMETEAEETDEPELNIEPVQWLDYDRIVQPHKQVVVKGYLRRLGMEIGPKAVWLYVGFHQAAWRVQDQNHPSGKPLHSHEVKRFSTMSNGAFWRLLKHTGIQGHLTGLVQRIDSQDARRFRRGRDGRPHRAPIRYQVFMTPRLTRADAIAVHLRLKALIEKHNSVSNALQELLAVEDVMDLLTPLDMKLPHAPMNTVMDMVHLETGETFSPEIERLAQELHRKIINCLGDIHIPHYFITETIKRYNLTPAQAWLITAARDMAFINARTGERRDVVTFKRGYQEMAELIGSNRYKTVQAWLHLHWTSQQRGGNLSRFLQEIDLPDSKTYADLRVESMPRAFRVLLDEPLDADGSNKVDANGSHMADADGSISWTQMGALADANGSHMVDANGSDLNSFKHPLNTDKKNTSTTQHACGENAAEAVAPDFWELETLLAQNDVHPKVQKELLEVQASVHAFVSWVLYVASPKSGNLSDPLGYAISRLREHPLREARGVFRQFADLPPEELLALIDSTPTRAYELPTKIEHPLAHAWKKAMGSNNPRLPVVREILFGEGASE